METEVLYESYERVYDLVIDHKFQIDFYIEKGFILKDSGEHLIRLKGLPFICKKKVSYNGVKI